MALNVTTAVFGEGCNTATASPSLAQWDVGQILKIEGVDLPSAYQVDFSTEYTRNAIQKIGNAAGVAIPNELLQRSAPITAYIVLHEGENDLRGIPRPGHFPMRGKLRRWLRVRLPRK